MVVRGGAALIIQAFLLLDVDDAQVKHWYLDFVSHLDKLLRIAQVVLLFSLVIKLVVLLLEQFGLLAILLGVLKQIQESSLSVVALEQLSLQFLAGHLVEFIMIVQLIKVIDQFLVVLSCHVRFHLLHVFDLVLVATHLLFHLLQDLVTGGVPLLHVVVPPEELFRLALHALVQRVLLLELRLLLRGAYLVNDACHHCH